MISKERDLLKTNGDTAPKLLRNMPKSGSKVAQN